MKSYDHKKIEKKWQKEWQKNKLYKTKTSVSKPKCYVLDMFPYPSGEGLHVGHPKGYIATDVYSRYKQMTGHNVLHPMGWDAFGLPAENYAIKNKVHPRKAVKKNVARYKEQLEMIGFNYDWDREINTTDPEYYKWTQWIFLELFKKGLAYESNEPINWCPSCKTGLANEDLENGRCERCGSEVEKKPIRQWVLRITDYAERLLDDLDKVNWPESIKELQRNWIGKSEGAEIDFKLLDFPVQDKLKIFTTRPDTIFGATFMAVSPELADKWLDIGWQAEKEVVDYVKKVLKDRLKNSFKEVSEKTGVFAGFYAENPANGEKIPVWITNYVLGDVGTGAIMAVPAHDERDKEFSEKFNLSVGSGKIIDWNESIKITGGKKTINYKLRDWVFSRQRYWGEPIPLIHCEKCGVVPVPEKDLPVKLPEVKSYEPTGTGESPLAGIDKWVNVKCPACGGQGKRETNTMPQWAGSCWYYLRFIDPKNKKALVDKEKEKYWMENGIDMYVGGAEHATRHLIYARFWHKFLYDIGAVSETEPFRELKSVGLILGEDNRKMSKRWGNVVNPDDVVALYGADTLRVYEMFMGPFSAEIPWATQNMIGSRRFIEKVWRLSGKVDKKIKLDQETETLFNQTIKKVGEDINGFSFNTAISALMILANKFEEIEKIPTEAFSIFLRLVAPFAPHVADELWADLDNKKSIHLSKWPEFDAKKLENNQVKIAIQINGKVRSVVEVDRGLDEGSVRMIALKEPMVSKWLEGKEIKKVIFIPDKIINLIVV